MRTINKLAYLGACFKSGQPIQGTQLASAAVRNSGLFAALKTNYNADIIDHGDIHEVLNPPRNFNTHISNLDILEPSLKLVNDKVQQILSKMDDNNTSMVTIGGDHSIATGTIHGLLHKYADLKVIWVDAHADIIDVNLSKYTGYHGMPLGHLLGVNDGKIPGFQWLTHRLPSHNIVHIGLRDADADQWGTLSKWNIKCYTADHVDSLGIGQVMKQALAYLDPKGNAPFHISFDIDALDPGLCSATGTMARGGLTTREGCHIVRRACAERKVVSMDVVEINPAIKETARVSYRGEEKYLDVTPTVGAGLDLVDSMFRRYLTL